MISKNDIDIFVMSVIERQPLNDYRRAENTPEGVVFRFVDNPEVEDVRSYAEKYGFIHGSVKVEDDLDPYLRYKKRVFMTGNEIGQYVWCRWFDLRRLHNIKPDIPVLYYTYERPPLSWHIWPDVVKMCYTREKILGLLVGIETIRGQNAAVTFFYKLWNASAANTSAASKAIDLSKYSNPNLMYHNIIQLLAKGDGL